MQTRISQYNPLADNNAHGTGPVWGSGAWLIGFITRITIRCYTQIIMHQSRDLCIPNYNIAANKTYKLWVLRFQRRRFSLFKTMADNHTPGCGLYEPQGH